MEAGGRHYRFDDGFIGIKGRLHGGDNGYRAIIDTNLILFFTWLLMLLFFAITGVSKFWRKRDLQSVYALSSLFGFIIIGILARSYQVFPIWGVSALMLAVFINWIIEEERAPVKAYSLNT